MLSVHQMVGSEILLLGRPRMIFPFALSGSTFASIIIPYRTIPAFIDKLGTSEWRRHRLTDSATDSGSDWRGGLHRCSIIWHQIRITRFTTPLLRR